MPDCPHCGATGTRVEWSRANLLRVLASVLLVPFYFLGGMAGDTRGPLLPLARRCPACGRVSKGRSVVDEVRGHRTG
jgi:hypothetical protein